MLGPGGALCLGGVLRSTLHLRVRRGEQAGPCSRPTEASSIYRDASSLVRSPCSTSYLVPPAARPIRRRTGVTPCAAAKEAAEVGPPKPNPRFSRQDLKRIKQQGPSIEDLKAHFEVPTYAGGEGPATEQLVFVPEAVLGSDAGYAPEPAWQELPQMSFMEFYHGLRQRNWTSRHYDPAAEKWSLKFFQDSGRFLRPSFDGWRVLVTRASGEQCWVNLDREGAPTFLQDYSGGGGKGAIFTAKRESQEIRHPAMYGSNQVFEQLFQAHEQQLSPEAEAEYYDQGWVDRRQHAYACPADRHLDLSFHLTPQEFSLWRFWERLPVIAFYGAGLSFLGAALAIGIFKPTKQMPSDMFQAIEFAQSKGKARRDGSTGITFADVGGLGDTIDEMMQVVEFLKAPKQYAELDAKPPKGILLEGEPGVGKTLVAKAIAGEAGVPFYQMAGSEFVEAIVGVGAARVRDLFARARVNAPCIIFVDEVDALGIKRAAAGHSTNEEREQTLNQLLSEMDGFSPDEGVVFVAATNRADLLDPALMRPGRFDRKILIERPDENGRYEVVKIHARKHRMSPDVDLLQLAKDLPGLSGAELGNVLNEAALGTVKRGGDAVTQRDVDFAVDRVLQGTRRPALPDDCTIKRHIAAHEAGRGLVATLLHRQSARIEPVERVSIIPRDRAWSRTIFARGRDEDYIILTRGRLLDRIRVVLAGYAAEELVLGKPSTYGVPDLRVANKMALRLVENYGLTNLGITTYAAARTAHAGAQKHNFVVTENSIDADPFSSAINGGGFQPSDANRHRTRAMAQEVIVQAYNANLRDLECHRAALEASIDALFERELLLGEELEAIMAAHPPAEPAVVPQITPHSLASLAPRF